VKGEINNVISQGSILLYLIIWKLCKIHFGRQGWTAGKITNN
jgi:hypothetical protein